MRHAWKSVLFGLLIPPFPPPHVLLPHVDQGKIVWSCDFEGTRCGLFEQSKTEPEPRSFFVTPGRVGAFAVALHTEPGDDNVHDSRDWERDDFQLPASPEYCNERQEEWWALSILFPGDYTESALGTVMDFHNNGKGVFANLHIITAGDKLEFDGFYGNPYDPSEYVAPIGTIERNVWYDVVLHMRWTAEGDGFMEGWVNGKKLLAYQGPTLYAGVSCYLKLANYHAPNGQASSVVFDRIIRGTSAKAVAIGALE